MFEYQKERRLVKEKITAEDILRKCAREVIKKNRKVFDELAKY